MAPPPRSDDDDPDRARDHDAAMQRVRVGVTGLAAVFLLTLLAASLLALLGQDGRPRGHGATVAEAPREPLAELGVAPGNAPKAPPPAAPSTAGPSPRPATPVRH